MISFKVVKSFFIVWFKVAIYVTRPFKSLKVFEHYFFITSIIANYKYQNGKDDIKKKSIISFQLLFKLLFATLLYFTLLNLLHLTNFQTPASLHILVCDAVYFLGLPSSFYFLISLQCALVVYFIFTTIYFTHFEITRTLSNLIKALTLLPVYLAHVLVAFTFIYAFCSILNLASAFAFVSVLYLCRLVDANIIHLKRATKKRKRKNRLNALFNLCRLLRDNITIFRLLFAANSSYGNAFLAFIMLNFPTNAIFTVMALFSRGMNAFNYYVIIGLVVQEAVGTMVVHARLARFSQHLHGAANLLVSFSAREKYGKESKNEQKTNSVPPFNRSQVTIWTHTMRLLTTNRFGFTYGVIVAIFVATPFKSLAVYKHYFAFSAQTCNQQQQRNQSLVNQLRFLIAILFYFILLNIGHYTFQITAINHLWLHVLTYDSVHFHGLPRHFYLLFTLPCSLVIYYFYFFYFQPNVYFNEYLKMTLLPGDHNPNQVFQTKNSVEQKIKSIAISITNLLETFIIIADIGTIVGFIQHNVDFIANCSIYFSIESFADVCTVLFLFLPLYLFHTAVYFTFFYAFVFFVVSGFAAHQLIGTVLLHVCLAKFSRYLTHSTAVMLVGFTARQELEVKGISGQNCGNGFRFRFCITKLRQQLTVWAHTMRLLTVKRYGFEYGVIGAPVTASTFAKCLLLYVKMLMYSHSLQVQRQPLPEDNVERKLEHYHAVVIVTEVHKLENGLHLPFTASSKAVHSKQQRLQRVPEERHIGEQQQQWPPPERNEDIAEQRVHQVEDVQDDAGDDDPTATKQEKDVKGGLGDENTEQENEKEVRVETGTVDVDVDDEPGTGGEPAVSVFTDKERQLRDQRHAALNAENEDEEDADHGAVLDGREERVKLIVQQSRLRQVVVKAEATGTGHLCHVGQRAGVKAVEDDDQCHCHQNDPLVGVDEGDVATEEDPCGQRRKAGSIR
ncbi:hypothetical protein TYRP_016024 [Tyrophagus putrescentiae]|nr:hypothetical protein TYRP_016024 [Tyrophagus putrescentiae]